MGEIDTKKAKNRAVKLPNLCVFNAYQYAMNLD